MVANLSWRIPLTDLAPGLILALLLVCLILVAPFPVPAVVHIRILAAEDMFVVEDNCSAERIFAGRDRVAVEDTFDAEGKPVVEDMIVAEGRGAGCL